MWSWLTLKGQLTLLIQDHFSTNTAALTVHTVVVLSWRSSPLYWREMCHHPCGSGTAVLHPWTAASYHRLWKGSRQFQIMKWVSKWSFYKKQKGPLISPCFSASFLPWWTISWSMRCCMRQTAVARSGASLWLTSQSMSSCATKQLGYVRRWYRRSLISFPSWSLNLEV